MISHNLHALSTILDYNVLHDIRLFRISSDLIPFGSHPLNTLAWRHMFAPQLQDIGKQIRDHGLRVSMHPGQYTVLNSPRSDVVERSIMDLRYHAAVLEAMELDATHKLILHVGGIYGDKASAMQRFISVYQTPDDAIKKRLIIENDDRYYTLEDVLSLSEKTQAPAIFDNLHHRLHPSLPALSERECLALVAKTWKPCDGRMKMHYSEQDPLRRKDTHAQSIDIDAFLTLLSAPSSRGCGYHAGGQG